MKAISRREVATTAQWAARGVSAGRLRQLVRTGDLVVLRRGVYARADSLASSADDPARMHALRVAAALLPARTLASASHESAAILHDLDLLERPAESLVTLTRPPHVRGSRASGKDLKIHAATLSPGHVTKHYGLPVTSVARTVVDLARTLPFQQGVVVADSALHARKTAHDDLARVLAACSNWPGAERARRVVAFSDHRSESVLESCARVTFDDYGLPAPELQVDIGDDQFIGRVDFYWGKYLTIAEADGMLKYADATRAVKQLERDQMLREAGYKVVHFTWRQLFRETDRLIARIRDAFARRGPL
ncbi:MAG TPA: type IV toxin-antitoxin system AbiEi family antitoxin domain-containing protein [Streptosporangiaceae bacterium]|nr:type IV toxin-antitoxin system AbiEi family antitoxin domain-containing protein [Streptosporangiaceae bacterium]